MDNNLNQQTNWLRSANGEPNPLGEYLRSLPIETIARLSQPTPEAAQVMESNLLGMLGGLPASHFQVQITTSREALGQLIASAMLSGYLVRNAEQRLEFEKNLPSS